ncbi:MAG: phosphate ABC transporter permease PstA [Solirubrobacterales bacterium]|nr:phosphate ABC transporter permease PstA [Solirubrobacterales bacterium]
MSVNSQTLLAPVSSRRRLTDRGMRALLLALTLVALVPLVLIIYYLLKEGLKSFSGSFFTSDPNFSTSFTNGSSSNGGGIESAIVGSIELVLIATIVSVPLGLGVALYLSEYGKQGRLATWIRYFLDVMTGVPSVVFGLFIYILLVSGSGEALWKASLALALLMLPIVARAAEVVLDLVPGHLREAALALGAPRWRVISKVVLPTAIPGLVTGVLLAVARGIGETAPVLFVAGGALGTTLNPGGETNALPLMIYNDISGQYAASPGASGQGWGAALTLVLLVLILNLLARLISRRSRLA